MTVRPGDRVGIEIREEWGVPYYWMNDRLQLVQRLNGRERTGRFIGTTFIEDDAQEDTLHAPCGDM